MLTDDATLKNRLFSLISGTETAHRYCILFLLPLANTHSYMPMCVRSLERHLMSCTCCVSAFDYLWSSFSFALLLLCLQTQWSLTFSRVVRVQHSERSIEMRGTIKLFHTGFILQLSDSFPLLPSLKHVMAYCATESANPSLLLRLVWPFPQSTSMCMCVILSCTHHINSINRQIRSCVLLRGCNFKGIFLLLCVS